MILGQDKCINENKIKLIHEQDIVKPEIYYKETSKNYKNNLKSDKNLKNNIKPKKFKKQKWLIHAQE